MPYAKKIFLHAILGMYNRFTIPAVYEVFPW
jgi:hypothetical protein